MKLSALEIKQQSFAKSIRGYDVSEVHSFLNVVANEWEHLSNKIRDQDREIKRLSEKLDHYQKVEEALHETLQAAKESSEQRISTSKQEAQSRIAQADLDAEKIVRDARQERQSIRQSIQRLLERRNEIIRGMESYLELATESLESFKRDDASTYSLPEDNQQQSDHADDTGQTEKAGQSGEAGKTGDAEKTKEADKSGKSNKKSKTSSPTPGAEDLDELLDDLDE